MPSDTQTIKSLLEGTLFASNDILEVVIPETEEKALFLELNLENDWEAWKFFRNLLAKTNHWPLIITDWSSQWQDPSEIFSRFEYQQEINSSTGPRVSPKDITNQSQNVTLETILSTHLANFIENSDPLEDSLTLALDELRNSFGKSPSLIEIQGHITSGSITNLFDLNRWLFFWQLEKYEDHTRQQAPDTSYLEWFQPRQFQQPLGLVLLPTRHSWESLAYIHWFGSSSVGSHVAIAFLRHWYDQYGAELVCHYGTMLHLVVHQKPITAADAFQLAWEQEALAPCTTLLPGVSLREHAWALLHADRWFLHERP
jgi:hypothetical protein